MVPRASKTSSTSRRLQIASWQISLFCDVSPNGQQFLFLRPLAATAADEKVELVQSTNWAAEVRAKLAGTVR